MSLLPTNVYSGFQGNPSNGPIGIFLQPDLGQLLYVSTISTSRIYLDGNFLDTTGTTSTASLLLNGTAVATASGLTSSIANWAQFGANSTITFATGGGSGGGIVMCNVSSLTAQAGSQTVSALTVSTLNGQTIPQLGQTIAYRAATQISTMVFNQTQTTSSIGVFSNFIGPRVQGTMSVNLSGTMSISNITGKPVQGVLWVTDNANAPYTTTSALGGQQSVPFFPLGPNSGTITAGTPPVEAQVLIPFAFSNAGANLYLIWSDDYIGNDGLSFAYSLINVSNAVQMIQGGGTACNV
jgi:hypothetical protein